MTITYMVQHPGALLKTCDTATPTSFQNVKFLWSPVIPFGCPNSLRRPLTKFEGVIP